MKKKLILAVAALIAVVTMFGVSLYGAENAYAATADTELCSTYKPSGTQKLSGAPLVVTEVTSQAVLDTVKADGERPTAVILNYKENGMVVGSDGSELCDFGTLYETVLKGKIIPILRVTTTQAADAMIAFYEENTTITDSAVLSTNAELLKKVRVALPKIRGVYEVGADFDLNKVPGAANAAYANTVIMNAADATTEAVAYIQARFKTVWARVASPDEFAVFDAIGSGAYGVVTTDSAAAYGAISKYAKNSLARTSFNVAHRGLPQTKNENSVSGLVAADQVGATHVELDAYLTTDKKIYMLHDGSLDRTTTGTGYIENYSSTELSNFYLDLFDKDQREKIPSIDDIFTAMQDNDIVLVLEIKSNQYADLINELKAKIEEYDMSERVTVISFTEEAISTMRDVLPEIPTSLLMNQASNDNFADVLDKMTTYNTTVDGHLRGANALYNRMLRDRGYASWFWTYDSPDSIKTAQSNGYLGLTNNYAASMSGMTRFVSGLGKQTVDSLSEGDSVRVVTTTFRGAATEEDGTVFKCEDRGTYYDVIATVKKDGKSLYTRAFRVDKTSTPGTEDPGTSDPSDNPGSGDGKKDDAVSGGCASSCAQAVAAIAAFACAAGFMILKVRKF